MELPINIPDNTSDQEEAKEALRNALRVVYLLIGQIYGSSDWTVFTSRDKTL